ncbi:hypothetical protein ACHAWO_013783 [Cyclotella atomus]|uniref:Replication termination factor 2 n=1 Tax=Cyclotella atomus TaxID=382360 RepID=A0ABD3PH47_9STRA
MGGDGGTISSNRAYLRGAGKADHTADHKRHNASSLTREEEAARARTIFTCCALSGETFDLTPNKEGVSKVDIVCCPYGRLYKRENVLEALLTRSVGGETSASGDGERIGHIRGRKDLHPVRFQIQKQENDTYMAVCPITGSEIGGGSIPCMLVVKSSASHEGGGGANVISERGLQEMGVEKLQEEYGPFEKKDLIRLAPSNSLLDDVKRGWIEKMEADRLEKKEKKRKRTDDSKKAPKDESSKDAKKKTSADMQKKQQLSLQQKISTAPTAAQEARHAVQSAVQSNPILSNLFGGNKKTTEKERRDALFTRNSIPSTIVQSNETMPTIQEDSPTVAVPAAASDGSAASAPLAVNASEIVNAAVNNSANVHLGSISNAPTTAETAQPSINLDTTSTDGGEASASPQLTQLSKEAKKAEAERKRKQRQDERHGQQKRQLEEMKRLPLEAVQLTADGSDILMIGTVTWEDVDLKYRLEYLKAKNIKYGRSRSKDALGPLIVNYLKAKPYQNAISNSRRSSVSSTGPVSSSAQRGNGIVVRKGTKPTFLLIDGDGTMFRAANVLKFHKECYIATKRPLDRSELDRGGLAHAVEWNTLTNTYNKAVDLSNLDDSIDLVQSYADLEVMGIDPMAASEHDHPLSTEQFMQLVGYMEYWYQKTCENCTKSALDDRMSDLRRAENFNTMMKCTEERDAAEEDMEKLDGELVTVKARRKEAKREGEEFTEEAEYRRLKKKCKKAHAKYDRLVQEVERLEKLLGYDDKSTGDVSSSSSSSLGDDNSD